MTNDRIVKAIASAVEALPAVARPYLLSAVAFETGLSPFLKDLLLGLLSDARPSVEDRHMAYVETIRYRRSGQADDAALMQAVIDKAGETDDARTANAFMAGLPSLIRAAEGHELH